MKGAQGPLTFDASNKGALRAHAARSGVVTIFTQGCVFALGLASTITMARLLSPREFGLVAMANTLTILFRMFRDAGLSVATIQKQGITHAQVSNLFWANIAVGLTITLVVAGLSPAIAAFYHEPPLAGITISLSIIFLISSMAVQPRAILQRQMRFKEIGLIDVGSSAIGLFVGIALGLMGKGYWSLVGLQVSMACGDLFLAAAMARWRPQLPERGIGTRGLLKFGASLTISNFLRQFAQSSDTILIGKFCGSVPTGLYSRALALLLRPVQQFLQPLESVSSPVLSRVQGEPTRCARIFLQACRAIALLEFSMAGLLFAVSDLVISVFLGPKWLGVIPIFRWLTVAALFYPLANAGMWILTTQGRSRHILITGTIFSFVTVISFAVGVKYGPTGVALAYALGWIVARLPIQYFIVGRLGLVSSWDQWKVLLIHLPLWGIVVLATVLAREFVLTIVQYKPVMDL